MTQKENNDLPKKDPSSAAEVKDNDSDDMEAEFEPDHPTSNSNNTASDDAVVAHQQENTPQPQHVFSPELLRQYYARLFPFRLLYEWLSYNPAYCMPTRSQRSPEVHGNTAGGPPNKTFSHREFSFTIEISPGEETYIRYQSFKDQKELEAAVRKRNPNKIDIGAVFSHPPKDRETLQGSLERKLVPSQRELVFDVDLTDYDAVRKCGCSSADICLKCWKMMGMAMKVMDTGLREDFGFQNIAWFYSGRRGVHAWVCDESARTLSDAGRSAVASYFEVNLGTDKNQNVELYNPLHPALSRAYTILEPMFVRDIITQQGHGLLACEEHWTALLETLPTCAHGVKDVLLKSWKKNVSSPLDKWKELKRYLDIFLGKSDAIKDRKKIAKTLAFAERNQVELWPVATVFRYTYPRLDINVSKMQNHLLKSPFCVHPKTGRVCVPMDIEKVDEFNPFEVPTLSQVIQELDSNSAMVVEEDKGEDGKDKDEQPHWKKTSLKESFEHFEKNFLVPMWKDLKRAEKEQQERRAALVGDF